MVLPLLIPLLLGGGAIAGAVGVAAARRREKNLEDALAHAAAILPAEQASDVLRNIAADKADEIRAKAVGIRTGIAENAVAKGIDKSLPQSVETSAEGKAAQEVLAPTTAFRRRQEASGSPYMNGTVTPMQRLGGWR